MARAGKGFEVRSVHYDPHRRQQSQNRKDTHMTLRVVARIRAQPDKVAEVRELLLTLIEPTRKEAGCITYELLQNQDDPADFTFVEEWASDASLTAHAASDHLRTVGAQLASLTTKPPEIGKYTLLA